MQSQDNTLNGIGLLIISTFFFAAQDAITKHLIETLSAFQIVTVRFFFFALFAIVYAASRTERHSWFRSANPVLQISRSLLITAEICIFAVTIQHMGLAEMHTVFACFPLLITALSMPLLGEDVGWRRWLAVFAGFLGTLIIIRPGLGVFNPWSLAAFLAALMFALYNILTRKVSQRDSFETSLLYFGVVGFLGSLVFALFTWRQPDGMETVLLLTISVTAIIGHLCLIKALELAPAVILQPFNYFVLVWAIVLGYLLFGEILDPVSLLGAAIVVASGVFIARREYRLKYS